jgi:hypothetical protein
MTFFKFAFTYKGGAFDASCHFIPPPPDKQFHITPLDVNHIQRFGDMLIIREEIKDQWTWGYPAEDTDHEFMKSLVIGLKEHLAAHNAYGI